MPMNKSTKDFVAIVDLQEGDHEYKFMVDGNWVNDKATEIKSDSGNNIIKVNNPLSAVHIITHYSELYFKTVFVSLSSVVFRFRKPILMRSKPWTWTLRP